MWYRVIQLEKFHAGEEMQVSLSSIYRWDVRPGPYRQTSNWPRTTVVGVDLLNVVVVVIVLSLGASWGRRGAIAKDAMNAVASFIVVGIFIIIAPTPTPKIVAHPPFERSIPSSSSEPSSSSQPSPPPSTR